MTADNFPILTEVLVPGQLPNLVRRPEAPTPVASDSVRDDEWEQIERDVRESVLRSLQARLDLVLDQRIKEAVAQTVAAMMNRVAADLRQNLNETIQEVVRRAVTQETARIRATRVG